MTPAVDWSAFSLFRTHVTWPTAPATYIKCHIRSMLRLVNIYDDSNIANTKATRPHQLVIHGNSSLQWLFDSIIFTIQCPFLPHTTNFQLALHARQRFLFMILDAELHVVIVNRLLIMDLGLEFDLEIGVLAVATLHALHRAQLLLKGLVHDAVHPDQLEFDGGAFGDVLLAAARCDDGDIFAPGRRVRC